jgi:hypothetical protein
MILYENITQEAFGLAIELASKILETMNTEDLCKKTGAQYVDHDRVLLNYLNRPYLINIRNSQISIKDNEKEDIPLKDRILILHYLTQAKGTPITNKLITYAQIQGGKFYCPVFQKRTVEPILRHFGNQPELLIEVSKIFGGDKARYGDTSISISPFPNIRFFIILWRGDDEIPPNGNILFDKNIVDYLSAEDIAVLSETVIWKLINMIRT